MMMAVRFVKIGLLLFFVRHLFSLHISDKAHVYEYNSVMN